MHARHAIKRKGSHREARQSFTANISDIVIEWLICEIYLLYPFLFSYLKPPITNWSIILLFKITINDQSFHQNQVLCQTHIMFGVCLAIVT